MDNLNYFIEQFAVSQFITQLRNTNLTWNNAYEAMERYDYSKFSQKRTDGLEKYEIILNGNRIIFSIQSNGADCEYKLEISYDDEPTNIYEIPYLDTPSMKSSLKLLHDSIKEKALFKYSKMSQKLFSCLSK